MADLVLMQVQINGSGIDSGEVDYLINLSDVKRLFNKEHLSSRKAYKDGIVFMLDELKRKTQDYYEEGLKNNPPTK